MSHAPRPPAAYGEGSKGEYNGYVSTIHITDMELGGSDPQEMCLIPTLRYGRA